VNCFNHRERPAVGLCKACGKALCAECLAEVPNGLACKNLCESRVNLINRLVDRMSQTMAARKRLIRQYGLVLVLSGIGIIIFALVSYSQYTAIPSFPYFCGFMGCALLVFGVLILRRKGQFPDPNEQEP
jgi:hypothetical protein